MYMGGSGSRVVCMFVKVKIRAHGCLGDAVFGISDLAVVSVPFVSLYSFTVLMCSLCHSKLDLILFILGFILTLFG